jgi:hypothetical protein
MFKEGDFLRHRNKPEWGTGKVLSIDAARIAIRFPHGTVTLKLDVAGSMLEQAERPSTPIEKPRSTGHVAVARCETCAAPLNRSRRSRDGLWKSCPKCSVRDGIHHVFWPFPDAFGVSQARVSGEDAEGAQSYCTSCRGRGGPSNGSRKSCAELEGMLDA